MVIVVHLVELRYTNLMEDEMADLTPRIKLSQIVELLDKHSAFLDSQRTNEISNIQGRYLEGGIDALFSIKQQLITPLPDNVRRI